MDDPEEVKEDKLDDVYPGRVGRLCSIKPLSLPAYYSKTTTYIDWPIIPIIIIGVHIYVNSLKLCLLHNLPPQIIQVSAFSFLNLMHV